MKKKITRCIKRTISILFALTVIFHLFYGLPIRMEINALEIIFTDPTHKKNTTLTIQGRYRLIHSRRTHPFRGNIVITDYSQTQINILRLNVIRAECNSRAALMLYRTPNNDQTHYNYYNFGIIYTSRALFRHHWIIFIGGANYGSDFFSCPIIVPNATNREEALSSILWFVRFQK